MKISFFKSCSVLHIFFIMETFLRKFHPALTALPVAKITSDSVCLIHLKHCAHAYYVEDQSREKELLTLKTEKHFSEQLTYVSKSQPAGKNSPRKEITLITLRLSI